jgi:hypothetical protein
LSNPSTSSKVESTNAIPDTHDPARNSGSRHRNFASNNSERWNGSAHAADDANIKLATDIFEQLIEINTSHSVGGTTVAAEAMAKRLRDAGGVC